MLDAEAEAEDKYIAEEGARDVDGGALHLRAQYAAAVRRQWARATERLHPIRQARLDAIRAPAQKLRAEARRQREAARARAKAEADALRTPLILARQEAHRERRSACAPSRVWGALQRYASPLPHERAAQLLQRAYRRHRASYWRGRFFAADREIREFMRRAAQLQGNFGANKVGSVPNRFTLAEYDADADGDGIPDALEDEDGDGIPDAFDLDCRVKKDAQISGDADGDGVPDWKDLDFGATMLQTKAVAADDIGVAELSVVTRSSETHSALGGILDTLEATHAGASGTARMHATDVSTDGESETISVGAHGSEDARISRMAESGSAAGVTGNAPDRDVFGDRRIQAEFSTKIEEENAVSTPSGKPATAAKAESETPVSNVRYCRGTIKTRRPVDAATPVTPETRQAKVSPRDESNASKTAAVSPLDLSAVTTKPAAASKSIARSHPRRGCVQRSRPEARVVSVASGATLAPVARRAVGVTEFDFGGKRHPMQVRKAPRTWIRAVSGGHHRARARKKKVEFGRRGRHSSARADARVPNPGGVADRQIRTEAELSQKIPIRAHFAPPEAGEAKQNARRTCLAASKSSRGIPRSVDANGLQELNEKRRFAERGGGF
jgi:hypothetical protein